MNFNQPNFEKNKTNEKKFAYRAHNWLKMVARKTLFDLYRKQSVVKKRTALLVLVR